MPRWADLFHQSTCTPFVQDVHQSFAGTCFVPGPSTGSGRHVSGRPVGGLWDTGEVVSTCVASAPSGPTGSRADDPLSLLSQLPGRAERLLHRAQRPARPGTTAAWPEWLHPELVERWQARGVATPWRHQVLAADAAHRGDHVVLATGTASGKSLGYQMPVLDAVLRARGTRQQRGATVLYLSPTKALAQDQWTALHALGSGVRVATHDGDSSQEQRQFAREHAEYLLTNPDMLHHSMLPSHEQWKPFWRRLQFVVVDEMHHYRGVFGAHLALVLRRLRRVAALHGASPTFVFASATAATPAQTATALAGVPVTAVTEDCSPRGSLSVGLWQPPIASHSGEHGAPVRRSAGAETADLLTDLVLGGVRTLAFVRSRRGVEQVAATTRSNLAEVDPSLVTTVSSYRGGYLPEERRDLEHQLRSGKLLAMAATNALELGIDVHGLDAVLVAGFPGTRAALWQQWGRAGRSGQDSLGLLIARDDPLDTYLVHHPEALLGAPLEATVFDPDNPYVLGPHLCAAAHEKPLTRDDFEHFGPRAEETIRGLTAAGLLRERLHGWFWTDRRRASDLADLRSSAGAPVQLLESGTGRVIGHIDGGSAHGQAHPGAVYLHLGESWLVTDLDLTEHVATLERAELPWSTSAREVTDISVVHEREQHFWGECRIAFGDVAVTHQVVSFLKRAVPGGEVIAEEPLDLPERHLNTTAVWWTVPRHLIELAGLVEDALPGAAHAAEHCSIGLLPLFATCDRWDIGGVSTALHPDTGELTVFVHDGHPGGAGFAERGYRVMGDWLRATRATIADCPCSGGCPSCVQSPKCGNQNEPLDKRAALSLLDVLLASAPAS